MTSFYPNVALDGYYTCADTSKLLGVSRQTINRWVRSGQLRITNKGVKSNRVYFSGRAIIKAWRDH